MIQQAIYSPQMLNTFRDCCAKYFYKFVKNIQVPQLETHFSVGKNIHALAAYYLNGEDISMFSLTETENALWETLKSLELFKLRPVKIESSISCKIDNLWIGGRIDALMKNNKNEYFILDYKTGKIPTNFENDFQTIIYLLCCDRLIQNYNSLSFNYISVKTGKIETVTFSENLKKHYEQSIKEICLEIQKQNQLNIKHTEKCSKCPYLKLCV